MNENLHETTGAYAMHALAGPDEARFEQHLAGCDACSQEVNSLRESVAELSDLLLMEPPASLRSGVLSRLSDTPQIGPVAGTDPSHDGDETDVASEPSPPLPDHEGKVRSITSGRSVVRRRWPTSLVAAAAAILVVGGGYTVWHSMRDDSPRTVAAEQVLDARDSVAVEHTLAKGGTATVTRSQSLEKAVIVTSQLPVPPAGKVYQLWFKEKNGTFATAGFLPAGGDQVFVLEGDTHNAVAAGITIEPTGGSAVPTTDPLALFSLA